MDQTEKRITGIGIVAAILALLILPGLSGGPAHTEPAWRVWGFDNFMYFSPSLRSALLLIITALAIPLINQRIQLAVSAGSRSFPAGKRGRNIVFAMLSLLAGCVFYMFRTKYFFLGDFNLRMLQIMQREFLETEYLTMRLLYHITVAAQHAGFGTRETFEIFSCLCGAGLMRVMLSVTYELADGITSTFWRFVASAVSGMLLIFCGYIEIYAFPVLTLSLYVLFLMRYLRGQVKLRLPLIFLLIAIGAHLIWITAIPSLLIAYYFRNKSRFTFMQRLPNNTIALLTAVVIGVLTFLLLTGGNKYILPTERSADDHGALTFLSASHLRELLNGQVLGGGVFLPLTLIVCIFAVVRKRSPGAAGYVFLSLSGGVLYFVMMADLQRGSGDWDIMSLTAIPLGLFIVCSIPKIFSPSTARYLLTAVAAINFAHTALWISINHTDRSIAKISSMLTGDPASYYASRITGEHQVAILYKLNKLEQQMAEVTLRLCDKSRAGDDVKACLMFADYLIEKDRREDLRTFYEDLIKTHIHVPRAYMHLLEYYARQDNTAKIHQTLSRLFAAFKTRPSVFLSERKFSPSTYRDLFLMLYSFERGSDQKTQAEIMVAVEYLNSLVQANPQHGK